MNKKVKKKEESNQKQIIIVAVLAIVIIIFHPKSKDIVDLVGHLAWPAVLLVLLFLLRKEVQDIFSAISKKIEDPNTNLSVSKEGLEIKKQVEQTKAQIEEMKVDSEQTQSLAMDILKTHMALKEKSDDKKIPDDLQKIADYYMNIEAPEWKVRVSLKDEAARKLANYVIFHNVDRELLAAQHHEGLILALAAASHTYPQEGDFKYLLRVAHEANRLHVKYRIVLAIGRLFERGLATEKDRDTALEVLEQYKHDADASLLNRIKQTQYTIQSISKK